MKKVSRKVIAVGVIAAIAALAVAVTVATAGSAKKAASIDVCVLLPETKTSVRWVQFDAPLIAKALKKAKVTYSITNALNDPQKMVAQADACLAGGAKGAIVTDAGASVTGCIRSDAPIKHAELYEQCSIVGVHLRHGIERIKGILV